MANNLQVGTYVVFLRDRRISELGRNRKDIWVLNRFFNEDEVELRSISEETKFFTTNIRNVVTMDYLRKTQNLYKQYFNEKAYNAYNAKGSFNKQQEKFSGDEKVMVSNKNMVTRTVDANTEAAKVAAKITAGKTLNSVVAKQLAERKILPIMVRGYVDTSFGAVVIANIADFAVKQFNVQNPKARLATEAMMQAAMVDLLAEIDFEGIINDVLSNVNLGEIEA